MHVITCRVCDQRTHAQADAVLLCAHCRTQPEQAARHVETVLAGAQRHLERLLDVMTVDTGRRLLDVLRTREAARADGTFAAFQRRYAATLAHGDALADILAAIEAFAQARDWAAHAHAELQALAHARADEVQHAHAS